MTAPGSNESPMQSLLMGIYSRLAMIEAMQMGNRQAMIDRTELIRREVLGSMASLKEEVFPRFLRIEESMESNRTATDTRLRELEIGRGGKPKPRSWWRAALSMAAKAIPLHRLAPMAASALIVAAMHIMPAEMNALLRPIVAPILQFLQWVTGR